MFLPALPVRFALFGKGGCALFKGGKLFRTVPLEAAVDELIAEAKAMME